MAESEPHDEGNYFPFSKEGSPTIEPPGEPITEESKLNATRSLTPRAPRFKHLSEAHRNITGQASGNATKGTADQPKSSLATIQGGSGNATATSSNTPVLRLQPVKSQDDLQISTPASKLRSSLKKHRRASFDSVDYFGDLSPKAVGVRLSLKEQMDEEMARIKAQAEHFSGSTIERLLEQYDVSSSAGNTNSQQTDRTKNASSLQDTSLIDSQHLLDAEAQVQELKQAGRDLIPLPLNVNQPRDGLDIPHKQPFVEQRHAEQNHPEEQYAEEQYSNLHGAQGRFSEDQYDNSFNYSGPILYDNQTPNPFAHPDDDSYQTYLQPPMERDISRKLRRASGVAGYSAGTMYSSDLSPFNKDARPQARIFTQDSLPTVDSDGRPIRNIKIVIGRESKDGKDDQVNTTRAHPNQHHASVNKQGGERHMPSDDADWVTEATSDVGFGIGVPPMPMGPLKSGYKQTGDSIADYSDDEQGTLGRFGSRERIIQHPAGDPYSSYEVQTTKDSNFAVLLPRRQKRLPENANRRWESTTQQEGGQFRLQAAPRYANPFVQPSSKRLNTFNRLAADVDRNDPAKHAFRDSQSDYEPAGASTAANCGTNWYDTHGTLPSVVSEYDEIYPEYPANRTSQYHENRQNPGFRLSMYEADRKKQLEKLNFQEFAAASPYEDLPSANSLKSKFNFELLPLDLAQIRNKEQRDSGQTNETESGRARLKRQQKGTPSDPKQPAKAFFMSRDLSIDFSPSSWETATGVGGEPNREVFHCY